MLRYLTAGESHGRALVAVLEGMPSGVPLTSADIARELARRRLGYGRGKRMRFEEDRFKTMLERGLGLLAEETERLGEGEVLPGSVAFKLYDTFGFPLDLTQDALREQGRPS